MTNRKIGLMKQSFKVRHEPAGFRWVARYWVDAGASLHDTEEGAWEACARDNASLLALEPPAATGATEVLP